jgi:predicted CoA-binding protein
MTRLLHAAGRCNGARRYNRAMATAHENIEDFLAQKRMALVGASRSKKHFTRTLWREFERRGYDVVPVNPNADELDGRKCYRSVSQIEPPVEAALIATTPGAAAAAADECARAGVRRVWLYRATGTGAATAEALEACARAGATASTGCPLMFFPKAGFPHNLHRWVLKLAGSYPK